MIGAMRLAGPASALLLLAGCAAADVEAERRAGMAEFPLPPCGDAVGDKPCVAHLFTDPERVEQRNPGDFPARYLEVYDEKVRERHCDAAAGRESATACRARLAAVAEYLNPKGKPDDREIGVALEGGGSKAAPFALGVLAGLQQAGMLEGRVTAISSVSGGSYAASYYFNRTFDRLKARGNREAETAAGEPSQWFRSCVPAYFALGKGLERIPKIARHSCGEKVLDFETGRPTDSDVGFEGDLAFMGHVWRNVDVMRGAAEGKFNTTDQWSSAEFLHYARLLGYSALSLPVETVGRGVFRLPFNSSPTKLFYKLGLERQYGYSPSDWAKSDGAIAHAEDMLSRRRLDRTLAGLGSMVEAENRGGGRIPAWIVNTTAPSEIDLLSWLMPMPRDPLRQTFELTWRGYGSGTYGYARQPPESYLELLGRQPAGMPIVDAVVASAAFFDEDQTRKSSPLVRVAVGTAEKALNQSWFTEIRNFNVGDGDRWLASAAPLPFYFAAAAGGARTPFIHLQDGGNAENGGLFSLLRRGYRHIVYAHGTQDETSGWEAICHLKNQLELDGTYRIEAPQLDKARIDDIPIVRDSPAHFTSYLDGLCSTQLDGSDMAAFDRNYAVSEDRRRNATAELFCRRLTSARMLPGNAYVCEEFRDHILPLGKGEKVRWPAKQAFYDWRSRSDVVFRVLRSADNQEIAAIHPVVPGISFSDFKIQVETEAPSGRDKDGQGPWDGWCGTDREDRFPGETLRKRARIRQCLAPDGTPLTDGSPWDEAGRLPCIALANLLEDSCAARTPSFHSPDPKRKIPLTPVFPQDSFILQTAHSSYTIYAAYFDLARQQTADLVRARLEP